MKTELSYEDCLSTIKDQSQILASFVIPSGFARLRMEQQVTEETGLIVPTYVVNFDKVGSYERFATFGPMELTDAIALYLEFVKKLL